MDSINMFFLKQNPHYIVFHFIFQMENLSHDDLFFIAMLLNAKGMYEESLKYLYRAIEISPVMDEKKQDIFFTPHREIAKTLRNSIKEFSSIYNIDVAETESQAQSVCILVSELSKQLFEFCNDFCALLNEQIIPKAENQIDKAVYLLVVGDFSRFVGELTIPEGSEAADAALESYLAAKEIADECLGQCHPVKLNIYLNYTILLNDILDKPTEAISLAQSIYNSATPALSELDEKTRLVSSEILQLLRDNATQWAAELHL